MANENSIVFDTSFDVLEQRMDRSAKIQAVIAQNIANANTPGYRPRKFDDVLNQAIERTDLDKVNLEEEMAAMAKNSIEYSAYVKLLAAKLNVLKSVVTQGRK